jgi:uncharacterized OB-fold protein
VRRLVWPDSEPRLAGSECSQCGHVTLPPKANCPACGGRELSDRQLGPSGKVERFAELNIPFDGHEAPYSIALVRLDEGGPLVITRVEGVVAQGGDVQLHGDAQSDVYWFRASE